MTPLVCAPYLGTRKEPGTVGHLRLHLLHLQDGGHGVCWRNKGGTSICNKKAVSPAGLCRKHLDEMRSW